MTESPEQPVSDVAPGARRWFSPAYAPDPALVQRGRLEMRLGVGLLMTGSVAIATAAAMASAPVAACVGVVVTQGIVAAGLFAGSRFARGLTMLSGALGALGAVGFAISLIRLKDVSIVSGDELALGAGLLLVAIGSSLATLAPAARAWHDLRGATLRARRKAKSLVEWRAKAHDQP
jgi:hypothetical protein